MKKLNKFVASAVAVAMIGGTSVAAFAAPATGDQLGSDQANLVKYLEIAEGVTAPTATFNFSIAPVSDSAYADTTHMPAAATPSIAVSAMSATAANDGVSLYGDINIINALGGISAFTHAGEYVYLARETGSTFTNTDTETMTLDEQAYLVHIYIVNGEDGLEVGNVTVETADPVLDDDNQPTGEYTGTGSKVAPDTTDPTVTDPTDEDGDDDTTDGEGTDEASNGTKLNGVVFDNNYQKIIDETEDVDPDPDDPTQGNYGALGVTKTVAGDYGDKTADFPFSITVNAPANWTGADTFTANIYTGDTKGSDLTLTYGTAYPFNLKDGQALAIPVLPAGATYTVTENLANNKYTPSYSWIDVTNPETLTGTAGQPLSLASAGLIADTDTKNAAYYTNTFDDSSVTPTGILINNLPYIALALVAIGGLIAYVVVRRRQSDEA